MSADLPKVVHDLQHLVTAILKATTGMPKQWRPSLAQRMEAFALDSLLSVRHFALSPKADKSGTYECLDDAITRMDYLEALVAVCHDLRCLSDARFAEITATTVDIRKQLFGLRKKYVVSDRAPR